MRLAEPNATAALLGTIGLLLIVSAMLSKAARRSGLPVALLCLGIGVAAGTLAPDHLAFNDYSLAFRLGTSALVLILFDGGLSTPLSSVRQALGPASVLATFGVAATAGLVGVAAHAFGLPWNEALLVGAVVSSTDAAAVFSVLRGSGVQLKRRVGITLELESGLNDPVAVILTLALTRGLAGGHLGWELVLHGLVQMAVGAALGLAIGYASAWLLRHVQLPAGGLYPVITVALALLAFGVPTLLEGSGFLAVYVAAVVLGNRAIRYRSGLLRVHDALAWLGQVVMFLLLGLLVNPGELLAQTSRGLAIGLFLAFVARPLVVLLCLAPFRYPLKEMIYVGWVGLRGAVPIILATYPILEGAPGAHRVFNAAFFVVAVNAVIPGGTVRWLTQRLELTSSRPPPPHALLELTSTHLLQGEVVAFYISDVSAAASATLADLPFPEQAAAMVVLRGTQLIAPRGDTVLCPGDHLYVVCRAEDLPFVELLFGAPEED